MDTVVDNCCILFIHLFLKLVLMILISFIFCRTSIFLFIWLLIPHTKIWFFIIHLPRRHRTFSCRILIASIFFIIIIHYKKEWRLLVVIHIGIFHECVDSLKFYVAFIARLSIEYNTYLDDTSLAVIVYCFWITRIIDDLLLGLFVKRHKNVVRICCLLWKTHLELNIL